MEEMVRFWKNKKVLITGHTGFKGSWLALWLMHAEAEVLGYALSPPTPINLFSTLRLDENILDIRGDIRDTTLLKEIITTHRPEIIFHLAAQPLVRYAYANPIETYSTNVMGTVNLLEAARHTNTVRAIINVTTDKCYENRDTTTGFHEDEPLGGYDPYSSSKACSELVTNAYRHSYFNSLSRVGLATARAGNVIGGGDWAEDRILPDLVRACEENRSLAIRYPNAVRPWQHVLEPLSGYLRLAEKLFLEPDVYSESWNFGPNENEVKPVSWIADTVFQLWGNKNKWQLTTQETVHEAAHLSLNCDKAANKLQWQPKWSIQQALAATVEWYRAYFAKENMKTLTLQQIKAYQS